MARHRDFKIPHGFFGRWVPFLGPDKPQDSKGILDHVGSELRASHMITMNQHHGNLVQTVEDHGFDKDSPCDGIVTRQRGVALAVRTADCAPVLMYDVQAQVIGAAHAGWRGAYQGILENTVQAMVILGAKKENISAMIGPCISWWHYPVKQDLKNLVEQNSLFETETFFKHFNHEIFFDLSAYCKRRLLGVKEVLQAELNTWSANLYSYRAAKFYGYEGNTPCCNYSCLMLPETGASSS